MSTEGRLNTQQEYSLWREKRFLDDDKYNFSSESSRSLEDMNDFAENHFDTFLSQNDWFYLTFSETLLKFKCFKRKT